MLRKILRQLTGARRPAAEPVSTRGLGGLGLLSLPLILFFMVPLLALLVSAAPARVLENLGQPEVRQAISLSLRTSLTSTALAVVLGTPLAYLLARRRFRGRRWLETLVELPTVLPPSVAGVALLIAFGRRGFIGAALLALGLPIAFTSTAVVLAQLFISAPLFVKAATLGFAGLDRELDQAAAIDGASPWQRLRYLSLPLTFPALLGGAVLAWARALGEFGATIIFAGNFPGRTQTMPLAIYIGFEIDFDVALALSVILIGTSFLVLIVVKAILQREADSGE
ncbi:MAG: ABC transporter permease [Anaerolineales bacterium]